MAGRAWFEPERRYVETNNPRDRKVALAYHGATPRGTFRCEVNGGPMYVQVRHGGIVTLCHWPDTAHDGCRLQFGMSDEHKRQQEYWAEAGSRAGYPTDVEVSTGNGTRLDVAIDGPVRTAIEVQRSYVTDRSVKSRTTKSFRAGWSSLWSVTSEGWPPWAPYVPTLRPTVSFSAGQLPPGTATAIGPRNVVIERCLPGETGPGCRRPCGRRHRPTFPPIRGFIIDNVAEQFPAGRLVPLQFRSNIVYLTPPEDLARYVDATKSDAAWTPGGRNEQHKREKNRGIGDECRSSKHAQSNINRVLKHIDKSADQYRYVARLVGAPDYPRTNRCSRCRQASHQPLVPAKNAWHCRPCAYPNEEPMRILPDP